MSLFEYIGWAIIAIVFLAVVLQIARMFEASCYDQPPTNTDTLLRGNKCANCMHSEISTVYPELACVVIGKHVEPNHLCDEWA